MRTTEAVRAAAVACVDAIEAFNAAVAAEHGEPLGALVEGDLVMSLVSAKGVCEYVAGRGELP